MITVALSSIPSRFHALADRLTAILDQRPDRICLTIPYRYNRFPEWDGQPPAVPDGVEILRADDRGPATKFLTVFECDPKGDVLIADDDCTYGHGWLDTFRAARKAHPTDAIAASMFDTVRLGLPAGHQIVQGFAGVLLRPCWLDSAVLQPDSPAFWVDDIWLSAHLALAGVQIAPCAAARALVTAGHSPDPLQDAVINGRSRAELNRYVAQDLQARLRVWSDRASPEARET